MDDALRDLWLAARSDIALNPASGIYQFWHQHWKDLGSPVGPEHTVDGTVYQAFTRGIVAWTAAGARVL